MNLFPSGRSLVFVLFLLPAVAPAQVVGGSSDWSEGPDSQVISLRELNIPSRVRDAFQDGKRRLAKNDFSGGAAQFRRAIAGFPDYYEAYYLLGTAEMNLHREEDAEEAFRKSIELSAGRYAPPHFGLGAVLCDQQNFAEAEATVRAGLELDSESWFGHYTLGWTMFGLDRLEEAEKSARQVVARRANLPEAYYLLASIHALQNNSPAVLNDLEKYTKLSPDSAARARAQIISEKIQRSLFAESTQ